MTTITVTETTTTCPDCAERVPAGAPICPECGSRPPARPAIRWEPERGTLHVPHGAAIPAGRCLVCGGARRVGRRTLTATWHESRHAAVAAPLALIGASLLAAIYLSAVQKAVSIDLPMCLGCRLRDWALTSLGAVLGLVGMFVLPFGGAIAGAAIGPDASVLGLVLGLVAFGAACFAWSRGITRRTRFALGEVDGVGATIRMPCAAVVEDVVGDAS